MIEITDLPHVNAALNATSASLLATGYVFVRRRWIAAHKTCMLAAFVTSTLFLTCYVIYHAGRRYMFGSGHVEFRGEGLVRTLYLAILVSHVLLAFTVVPLSLVTLYRAFRDEFERHRRIARWTLPIWLYVSVTGVVVYWMLYWAYPSPD